MKYDLLDPNLFGNDAAEDEDEAIFTSYAVTNRPYVRQFLNPQNRILIANAYKGEGKSALLRITSNKIERDENYSLIVKINASNISPNLDSGNHSLWKKEWKKKLLLSVASEVGRNINIPWGEDTSILVEAAEREDTKQKGFLSFVLERLNPKISLGLTTLSSNTNESNITSKRISRISSKSDIWVFIDDADENFENTIQDKAKISSLLSCCRDLIQEIPNLVIRTTIRPNVLACIEMEYESISKMRQYFVRITWKEKDLKKLLEKRLKSYQERKGTIVDSHENYIPTLFEDPMPWGSRLNEEESDEIRKRPPHIVLSTLSKQRPRWMIELCKSSASLSEERESEKIMLVDISESMRIFGENRVKDLIAEFKSMCPNLGEIIASFHGGQKLFSTNELMIHINQSVLTHINPIIYGKPTNKNRDVASVLFQVGFIYGYEILSSTQYRHVSYYEDPLLFGRINLDKGYQWEIHPIYRQYLRIFSRK